MDKKLLSYSKWGRMGNFSNMQFELAALYGMGKRYNRDVQLPVQWKWQEYFKNIVPIGNILPFNKDINEPQYEFTEWKYWDEKIKNNPSDIVSVSGWFQSEQYWENNREFARELFDYTDELKEGVRSKFEKLFEKPVIGITIRVGQDYKDNGNYIILPIHYYIGALYKHFPDWRENYNILICADDFEYAKLNFDCSDNIFFAEGMNAPEQQFLLTQCQNLILANSTFSWWAAYLSNAERIIRPEHYFKGYLATNHTTKTFWLSEWIIYNHTEEKLDLKDVTFTIPITYDHKDREENLHLLLKFLNENFYTNIMIHEQGNSKFSPLANKYDTDYYPYGDDMIVFHRTKILNIMANDSFTPYIINYDADNIIPPLQLMMGRDMLKNGEADCIYPYDGRCARVSRVEWYRKLMEETDCGILKKTIFRGTRPIDAKSVGHIIMWNKEKFIEGGGENENFISYGPEDVERWERFTRLGYTIKRIKGITYHIDHFCGNDSSGKNPYFGRNYEELERVRKLTIEQLKNEIGIWKKNKKTEN